MSSKRERRWWTEEEDQILKAGVESQSEVNSLMSWNEIAAMLPRRTNKDCRKRWYKVRSDFIKGTWSREEDRKLQQAVQQHGLKWALVSRDVESRNADQCAKRWQHGLRPDLKHTPWQPEEDTKLLQAMDKHGNKWKKIATLDLPNRSSHDIRNRSVVLSRREKRLRCRIMNDVPQSHGDDESNDDDETAPESDEDDGCDDYDDSGVSVVSSRSQLQSPSSDLHMDSGFTSGAASPRPGRSHSIQESSNMMAAGNHDWTRFTMLQEQLLKAEQLQQLHQLQHVQATPPPTPVTPTWYEMPGVSDATVASPKNGYPSYLPMGAMPLPPLAHNSMTDENYLGIFDNYVHSNDIGPIDFRPQVNHDWRYEMGYAADPFVG
ncbi:hypothetical protein PG993_000450 [Apiospora rasikravindrae]|uniref:Uncharacterized protein n=1 Tax=Apiospora rasikravindrae TaxID=990691 RepID=A0ABR1U8L0_9PEZI